MTEYEEWINDPVAQAEYQLWRTQEEINRLAEQINLLTGENHEPIR